MALWINRVRHDSLPPRGLLAHLEAFAKHHDNTLNRIINLNENILDLDKKMESMTKKRD